MKCQRSCLCIDVTGGSWSVLQTGPPRVGLGAFPIAQRCFDMPVMFKGIVLSGFGMNMDHINLLFGGCDLSKLIDVEFLEASSGVAGVMGG